MDPTLHALPIGLFIKNTMEYTTVNDTTKARSFRYIIVNDKLVLGLESLMQKITTMRGRVTKNSYVPLFISLNIHCDGTVKDITFIKSFLKQLKVLQKTYFVRFITDLWWVEQADALDAFYTFDGNIRDICDISWDIRTRDYKYLEVITKIYKPNDSHIHLRNISRKLSTIISDLTIPTTIDEVGPYLDRVYTNINGNKDTRDIDNNFHVLLVYNTDENNHVFYNVIPVVGMNHLDAERRYVSSYKDMLEHFIHHNRVLLKEGTPSPDTVMTLLISMIRDNEDESNKNKRPSVTYALGELLFSYFVMQSDEWNDLTRHDLIMFRPAEDNKDMFDTFVVSMDDSALEIFK